MAEGRKKKFLIFSMISFLFVCVFSIVIFGAFIIIYHIDFYFRVDKPNDKNTELIYLIEEVPAGIELLDIIKHQYFHRYCSFAVFEVKSISRNFLNKSVHGPKSMSNSTPNGMIFEKFRPLRGDEYFLSEFSSSPHRAATEAYSIMSSCDNDFEWASFLTNICFNKVDCVYYSFSKDKMRVIIINTDLNFIIYSIG